MAERCGLNRARRKEQPSVYPSQNIFRAPLNTAHTLVAVEHLVKEDDIEILRQQGKSLSNSSCRGFERFDSNFGIRSLTEPTEIAEKGEGNKGY